MLPHRQASFSPSVPLADMRRHTAAFEPAFHAKLQEIFDRGQLILGPECEAFEREFAQWLGVSDACAVANGTDALEIALRAVGVNAGDEVITVANAGFYSSTAILACGAVPVYADVDNTLTLAPEALRGLITPKTRAIVVTHLYGKLANIAAIADEAAGIPIVEDCAQAHGATRNGKMAGNFGDVGAFSFYPTKNLGALGDGGMVATSNSTLAKRMRQLRQYGWEKKYAVALAGGRNSRLDELQAGFLRIKLPHLMQWNEERRAICRQYRNALSDAGKAHHVVHAPEEDCVVHLCVLRHPRRDWLQQQLAERSISSAIHYPIPDHQQAALRQVPWRAGALPVTERAVNEVLSIPCFPGMTEEEISWVAHALRELL